MYPNNLIQWISRGVNTRKSELDNSEGRINVHYFRRRMWFEPLFVHFDPVNPIPPRAKLNPIPNILCLAFYILIMYIIWNYYPSNICMWLRVMIFGDALVYAHLWAHVIYPIHPLDGKGLWAKPPRPPPMKVMEWRLVLPERGIHKATICGCHHYPQMRLVWWANSKSSLINCLRFASLNLKPLKLR